MREVNNYTDNQNRQTTQNNTQYNAQNNASYRNNLNNTNNQNPNMPQNPNYQNQGYQGNPNYGYNQNAYNQNRYNQNGYNNNMSGKSNSGNTGLIAAICVLAGVIVIAVIVVAFMVTGVLDFGGSKAEDDIAVVTEEAVPTLAPATAAPENNIISGYVYVANVKNSIYLRSAPVEDDSNIITTIPLGTQVGFIENADSVFAKINYNGQVGYAKQVYLSETMPSITSTSSDNSVKYYVYVANVKYSIYLRSAPAENDSNIITEIPLGTQVGFIENTDSVFAKIKYNGTVGYAKRIYLSDTKPSTASSSSSSSSTMTVVNVKYAIYLRSSASEASDDNIIAEIPVGATVTYLGTPNSTFYKISYNGQVGYSKQIYLSFN